MQILIRAIGTLQRDRGGWFMAICCSHLPFLPAHWTCLVTHRWGPERPGFARLPAYLMHGCLVGRSRTAKCRLCTAGVQRTLFLTFFLCYSEFSVRFQLSTAVAKASVISSVWSSCKFRTSAFQSLNFQMTAARTHFQQWPDAEKKSTGRRKKLLSWFAYGWTVRFMTTDRSVASITLASKFTIS